MLRRSFLSRFSAAATLGLAQDGPKQTTSPQTPPVWRAARHPQDDWFDELPGKHRVILDSWMADKFPDAMSFASNYVRVNKEDYGLSDQDLAVVICVRHRAAPFAFNDAMWRKYGKALADRMQFSDPKTHETPTTNVYGQPIVNLLKQGVQLAVCNLTTRAYTRILAQSTGTDAETIYKELTANTLGSSHFVPAGVVAVTRAQERGYALVSIG